MKATKAQIQVRVEDLPGSGDGCPGDATARRAREFSGFAIFACRLGSIRYDNPLILAQPFSGTKNPFPSPFLEVSAMRLLISGICLMCAILLLTAGTNFAQDKKEVVLKGSITCAKCDLKVEKKCATVIVVKEGKKDVVYYFDTASHKTNHETICQAAKPGTVTGTIVDDGKKKVVTVKKVEFDK
jgi:Family of unknown function (DUF6370)